ncbi:RagB/SusD family nutrient uptake outer membrane protein [Flaviaesturariibacter flavus]|uniref:RagB/SusD family nutrient uptake outer membrane protein n=1 Tax=Flaviaesturariibacter flavus TaxID=2502780 RepID=A0A4R1BK61_9BACT|nr:RagB/SusD family nutrient uptake outer membrane protein [Flaviaesturariibacter flavus]TCJ17689.1 RagB/SusD family nutrient uptake outer membrane protein [Flaviaesturariibacter flavus]
MNSRYYFLGLSLLALVSCRKNIETVPQNNLSSATYYSNLPELKSALTGVYNGMQAPLTTEWRLTELRTDNSKQGVTNSSSSDNLDLNKLDMFSVPPTHDNVLQYWLATYANIRNANLLLQKIGVKYDPAAGATSFTGVSLPVAEADLKQVGGEALFIRAYHYFNLVRLYGGVFLVHEPIGPNAAFSIGRSSVADMYRFIEADLKTAIASMSTARFGQQAPADIGRATSWAAKGMLAKVYLTQGRKAEAITLLQDVIANSGYGLAPTYAEIFAPGTEMGKEILFAVRFKSGGLGLGSPFANDFAALNGGIVSGQNRGWNHPTYDIDSVAGKVDTATNGTARKVTLIAAYGAGPNPDLYVKKYISPVTVTGDAENDWPVLRFADILLMLAEAQGNTPASVGLISQVHQRAGNGAINPAAITSVADFEKLLADERRVEFAFENQRWFDLVRYNTTFSTITAEAVLKAHFAIEYSRHYAQYQNPTPPLAELQGAVTRDHLLLPIPQREIDTNTQMPIPQNPGY